MFIDAPHHLISWMRCVQGLTVQCCLQFGAALAVPPLKSSFINYLHHILSIVFKYSEAMTELGRYTMQIWFKNLLFYSL